MVIEGSELKSVAEGGTAVSAEDADAAARMVALKQLHASLHKQTVGFQR